MDEPKDSNFGESDSFNQSLRAWFIENGFSRTSRSRVRNHIESGWDIQRLAVTKRSTEKAGAEIALLERHGVSIVNCLSSRFPSRLKNIDDAPLQLFVKGKLAESSLGNHRAVVAIVGTRQADNFGKCLSSGLARELRKSGVQVVSGLARGIDSAAHRGALSDLTSPIDRLTGPGIACLGSGVLRIYPRENQEIADQLVAEGGALISEYGLFEAPRKHHFPERNRIISGLADLVVVVQADLRSGSMITANLAADQGREVAVFPGRVNEKLAAGTLELARNGATLVRSGNDILEILRLEPLRSKSEIEPELSNFKRRIVNFVAESGCVHFDQIVSSFSEDIERCYREIGELEVAGWLVQEPGDFYAPGTKAAAL